MQAEEPAAEAAAGLEADLQALHREVGDRQRLFPGGVAPRRVGPHGVSSLRSPEQEVPFRVGAVGPGKALFTGGSLPVEVPEGDFRAGNRRTVRREDCPLDIHPGGNREIQDGLLHSGFQSHPGGGAVVVELRGDGPVAGVEAGDPVLAVPAHRGCEEILAPSSSHGYAGHSPRTEVEDMPGDAQGGIEPDLERAGKAVAGSSRRSLFW